MGPAPTVGLSKASVAVGVKKPSAFHAHDASRDRIVPAVAGWGLPPFLLIIVINKIPCAGE